jgi:hypothetical protein
LPCRLRNRIPAAIDEKMAANEDRVRQREFIISSLSMAGHIRPLRTAARSAAARPERLMGERLQKKRGDGSGMRSPTIVTARTGLTDNAEVCSIVLIMHGGHSKVHHPLKNTATGGAPEKESGYSFFPLEKLQKIIFCMRCQYLFCSPVGPVSLMKMLSLP